MADIIYKAHTPGQELTDEAFEKIKAAYKRQWTISLEEAKQTIDNTKND